MASPSSFLELTLSLKPSYLLKPIQNVLTDLEEVKNPMDKLMVLNDYIHQHEEELNFIQSFKHQIPLCGLFLVDAIKTLSEESMKIRKNMESGGQPMMEFLSKGKEYGNILDTVEPCNFRKGCPLDSSTEKSNGRLVEKGSGSTFPRPESSGIGNHNLRAHNPIINNHQLKPLTQSISKKKRMSWTEENHTRFLRALHQAGGIDAATPKRILEKMQVKGLTNDQVKSHLQKYRLHQRSIPANKDENFTNSKAKDPWASTYYGNPRASGGSSMSLKIY
ncbi:hypothetical protein SLE2022_271000 [Rubroshorea leprosula]